MANTSLKETSTFLLRQSTDKVMLGVQVFECTCKLSGYNFKSLNCFSHELDDQELWIAAARWDLSC